MLTHSLVVELSPMSSLYILFHAWSPISILIGDRSLAHVLFIFAHLLEFFHYSSLENRDVSKAQEEASSKSHIGFIASDVLAETEREKLAACGSMTLVGEIPSVTKQLNWWRDDGNGDGISSPLFYRCTVG